MNKTMPIEKGLASKIYLLAYPEPKSGYEIAKEIYGHDHHRVRTVIKKLAEEGYFMKVEKDEWKWPKWISNVGPLIKRIQETNRNRNINMSDFDKYVIRKLLDNFHFRDIIKRRLPKNLKEETINAMDFILNEFETVLILRGSYPVPSGLNRIHTAHEYENYIERYNKNDNAKEKIQQAYEKNPIFDVEYSLRLAEGMSYWFNIPKQIFDKCKRISSFGDKYHELKYNIEVANYAEKLRAMGKDIEKD